MGANDNFLNSRATPGIKVRRNAIRFRTVWISDTHLGTSACQAAKLLEFLRGTDCETLYLVGDIVDAWQLKRGWNWDQTQNNVVQAILKKARRNTRVFFVPGNHDQSIRHFIDLKFGGIEVKSEIVHTTADGRRLLVLHGDRFDGVVSMANWLPDLGTRLRRTALRVHRLLNAWRTIFGMAPWSLRKDLKLHGANADAYTNAFEVALAAEAKSRGYDGVICGHIHKPRMRYIDGVLYCNDGDWVDSLTAITEAHDGELRLLTWRDFILQRDAIRAHRLEEDRTSLAAA